MIKLQQTEELVIRDIFDQETNRLLINQAVLRRTVVEELIGYQGVIQTIGSILLQQHQIQVPQGEYRVTVNVATIMHDRKLYNAWIVQQLPWTGKIVNKANTSYFLMASSGGIPVTTFLNPRSESSCYMYIHQQGTEEIRLLHATKHNNRWELSHPCVSNTNSAGVTCIGDGTFKAELYHLSDARNVNFIKKLLFSQFNADWFNEWVSPNNQFHLTTDNLLQHQWVNARGTPTLDYIEIPTAIAIPPGVSIGTKVAVEAPITKPVLKNQAPAINLDLESTTTEAVVDLEQDDDSDG